VQRQRERVGVGAEQLRRSVALVDVAVDDQHAVRPQHRGRHCDVVDEAVPARGLAAGVVGTAAEVHPDAVAQGVAGRLHGAARRAPRALDELRRPRQAERPLLAHRQLARPDALEQRCIMHEREGVPADRGRVGDRSEPLRLDPLGEQRVLRGGEAVPLREREAEAVVRP
jgi:hypothetical protein